MNQKQWNIFKKTLAFLSILYIIIYFAKNIDSEENQIPNKKDGDLNSEFVKHVNNVEERFNHLKDSLIASGWKDTEIQNGPLPECYNFVPQKGKIDNYLEVYVGGGTDVVIKLMNLETEKCVRYVFINSNSTFRITHIPEGKFYLKIAYGKNWLSKVVNNQCIGKFIRNPFYERGKDILDFNTIETNDGYQIPNFSLRLDVIETDTSNSFDSQNISEGEFNL